MSEADLTVDNFNLINCVATGNTSQVWEVAEQGSGRHLAMKLLLSDSPEFAEAKASLKHEASVSKTLDHPNVITFEKYVSKKDNVYILMEYFRAPNLKLQLKNNLPAVQARVRRLFELICLALAHIHQKGWVHRDVKPDNILFNKASELRLIDFSLAVRQRGALAKALGGKVKAIQGTRTYIAPETIRKQAAVPQTDMYSLGITMFEVLTGKTPFQGATPDALLQKHLKETSGAPSEYNPNVTPEMDRIVLKLMSKKPSNRYGDMNEVYAEVRRTKIFREDVDEETVRKRVEEEEKKETLNKMDRLNSRSDALRQEMMKENPEMAKAMAPPRKKKPPPPKPKPATPAPAAQGGQQPQPVPGHGQPGYPPPGYGYPPGYPMPPGGQYPPPPGYPQMPPAGPAAQMPGHYPPYAGQPMPQHPGQPIPQHPGQPMPQHPGQPMPQHPGQPMPQHPGQPMPQHPGQPLPPGQPGHASQPPPGQQPQPQQAPPGQAAQAPGQQQPQQQPPPAQQQPQQTPEKPEETKPDDLEYMTELPDIL